MFVRTPRLMLRPGWAEDAPALCEAIGDASVVRNLARAPWPYGITEAAAFLAQPQHKDMPNFLMFQRTLGEPRLIGGCALSRTAAGGYDLGYWVAPLHWGLGYATEAGRAVLHIARYALQIDQIEAHHFVDNPASGRVLAKLGFRPSGKISNRPSEARAGRAPSAHYVLRTSEAVYNDVADQPDVARQFMRQAA
jgi:RimJ/RimL family protein N-acetyltransferase